MEVMRHSDMKLVANIHNDAMPLPSREAVLSLPNDMPDPTRN
jgi:hypothetical protein